MKVVYLTVRVVLEGNVNVAEFAQEADYVVDFPGVIETEIIDAEEK